jgi:hypothetical protein
VGGRVVDRQPSGLGDDDDHQRDEREHTGQRRDVARVLECIGHQGTEIG